MNTRDDLASAWRSLSRSPGFVAVAVLTLALGIGSNSAIFSIVNAVLLKPLDWPQPQRLVFLHGELRQRSVDYFPYSPPDLRTLNEEIELLEGVAGYAAFPGTLAGREGPGEQINIGVVTGNFFRLLGVGPFVGRDFDAEDTTFSREDVPDGTTFPLDTFAPPRAAIISHALWQRRFGSDPQVIGRQIEINGNQTTVVGIMPPGFRFELPPVAATPADVDVWTPLRVDYANVPRSNVFLNAIGRLVPGASLEQAQQELDAWDVRMKERYEINRSAGWYNHCSDFHRALTTPVRPSVLILMAAVAFVLLIACANVANLLLVRASTRARETAIRAAVGGSRARLLSQMLIEAGLLASGGAASGLLLARAGIELLDHLSPANLPRADDITLDVNVVAFTVGVAIAATLVAGLVPALGASRPDLVNQLRERSAASRTSGGKLFRDAMVVLEVTLSFVLLVSAGLMVRSFIELNNVDPGFDPRGVLTFQLNFPIRKYPLAEQQIRFMDEFKEQLEGLPGVVHTGGIGPLPLAGGVSHGRYATEENAADAESFRQASYKFVKGEYFQTMRTPLIAGRLLDRNDELNALPNAVIDELLATRAFPGRDPLGKRLVVRLLTNELTTVEVVGVVRHQAEEQLQEVGREAIYITNELAGFPPFANWTVRSSGDPMRLVGPIKALVEHIDADVIVTGVRTMQEIVAAARAPTWFALSLIGLFGVLALILAAVGLYSVLAYVVRLRQNELGVRIAFGATPRRIFRLIIGRGLALTALGVLVGVALGLSVTRLMQSLLVGVTPSDPQTFLAVSLMFLGVALLAAVVPARRATRVDPVVSLRND